MKKSLILVIAAGAILAGLYFFKSATDQSASDVNSTSSIAKTTSDLQSQTGQLNTKAAVKTTEGDQSNNFQDSPITTEQQTQAEAPSAATHSEKATKPRTVSTADEAPADNQRQFWSTDAQGIQGAMAESLHEITDCYDPWLKAEKKKNLVGTMKVTFTIETDPTDPTKGKATHAKIVDSQLDHKFLESCVISVVSNLTFQPPNEKVEVTYPFHFSKEP